MAITAAQVKELRERTGAGMMDCKNALTEANGDIELAIENMRKSGAVKAAKKAGRIAAEGVILTKSEGNVAVLLEVNCETDFVARDVSFLAFGNKVVELALANNITDINELLAADLDGDTVENTRAALVAKIGENINVRRVFRFEGENLGVYIHSSRIGVVTELKGGDADLAKDLAMHVAASNPQFVKPSDVPAEVVEKEKEIQIEIAMQSGKPKEIAEKMVAGRMAKFTGEVSLTGQPFVKDPSIIVADLLKQKGADVINFTRIEVGEGIEKKEEDFAAEVAAQIAASKKA
ncbi:MULTISPECIES: translation elongation factor Ts [Shewanella]|jgi:elongation factor Ts|uniref:Elongation factor Ts n=1 Tax=Shewanella fodinae TaxID=552357 RepID=A0A4R2FJK3_9GAMM|nr:MULTISPECIES: translation elongation factor Ts [Shewanella]MBO1270436.1 elongation factor Ts [Shewanella sp. 4t3-1-2LB]MDN5368863.1 elongation factor Ts [Shewanella sp.]TCN87998.1 elongation factor Ts [Shewanella fodinae]